MKNKSNSCLICPPTPLHSPPPPPPPTHTTAVCMHRNVIFDKERERERKRCLTCPPLLHPSRFTSPSPTPTQLSAHTHTYWSEVAKQLTLHWKHLRDSMHSFLWNITTKFITVTSSFFFFYILLSVPSSPPPHPHPLSRYLSPTPSVMSKLFSSMRPIITTRTYYGIQTTERVLSGLTPRFTGVSEGVCVCVCVYDTAWFILPK